MATKLKIYNTLTNKKEEFKPIDPNHITMYVCGPTVYDFAHVGNARPVVVFDTLARLLRHDFGKLTYARNITDIDDKIIEASQKTGEGISVITEKFTLHYEEDMAQLNAEMPDIIPKATDYIDEMIELISDLVEKGHAYEAKGHVLFHVSSIDDYGELSGRTVADLLAGARVDVASYKKEAPDFVLWKPSTDDQPGWDSPWGRGRPGWHTECSAMIEKNFGTTIDIHGGGQDLIFPHHENEIAQSKCSHGGAALANHWMHNGYLTVNGEKMSKSLGNFITVHELLKKFPSKGEAIRYLLLSAHYRQPVDFVVSAINDSKKILDNWYRLTEKIEISDNDVSPEILDALRNDLDTPKALSILHDIRNKIAHANDDALMLRKQLKASAQLLGFLHLENDDWFGRVMDSSIKLQAKVNVSIKADVIRGKDKNKIELGIIGIQELIDERAEAKKNKDFNRADEIRNAFEHFGITLLDGPNGTTWEKN